jgi:predicted  nucleic acid-binding Zn ribbon protein
MFAAELTFKRKPNSGTEECFDALDTLLSALRNNGQILDDHFFAESGSDFRGYVELPEVTSLDHQHDSKYVKLGYEKLAEAGLTTPLIKIVGKTNTYKTCYCDNSASYLLYTTYSSPVKCGDCFNSVPLYRLPKTYDNSEYYNLLAWAADHRCCDGLQRRCETGERFGTREISNLNSSLSKRGRALCQIIEQLTGKPTYYYLYRYVNARSFATEQKRLCPSCKGEWLLAAPLHEMFDFCCEPCRLLSNISWNVR